MFDVEAEYRSNQKRHGYIATREFFADINKYTTLQSVGAVKVKGSACAYLCYSRSLFDWNEHFVELSNIKEDDRSNVSLGVLLSLFLLIFSVACWIFMGLAIPFGIGAWYFGLGAGAFMTGASALILYLLWPDKGAPTFFTSLRARYRFNRTTRKVYVLRPKRYGGNVTLDWDKVQAHPNWCAGLDMTPKEIHDPRARELRQQRRGGPYGFRCLVLYWPADEQTGQAEEVLWVGPKLSGEELWHYIWTFMEKGMDAVRPPNEHEWLRKGFHTPLQHVRETELSGAITHDVLTRKGQISLGTRLSFVASLPWALLHCLIERTCYWPTFPPEWNSDCGQLRREKGIGPEEPLRWVPRNLDGTEMAVPPVVQPPVGKKKKK